MSQWTPVLKGDAVPLPERKKGGFVIHASAKSASLLPAYMRAALQAQVRAIGPG